MSRMASPPRGWGDRPCRGTLIELWFGPPEDGPGSYDEPGDQRVWRERRAKQLCASCPVRGWCLEQELALPVADQWGVRGGMTAAERKEVDPGSSPAAGGVVRLRLLGTASECAAATAALRLVFEVLDVSAPFPSRRRPGLVRVFVTVRLRAEGGDLPVRRVA